MDRDDCYTLCLETETNLSRTLSQITGWPSRAFTDGKTLLVKASTLAPLALFIAIESWDEKPLAELRKIWPFVPFILLTGQPQDESVGRALAQGADDFLQIPLTPSELTSRLDARLREMSHRKKLDTTTIGDFEFSPIHASLAKDGKLVHLPRLEVQLLTLLIAQGELIASRQELKQALWGRIAVSDNTLDRKISDLRKALLEIGSQAVLQSHYRKGISLCLTVESKKIS